MRIRDYPPQEPANPIAVAYRQACVDGSFGVAFSELFLGEDPHQSLAFYPTARSGGPLFAFMHGGGWTNGYKETMGFMAPAFQAHGIAFASIGYRLAPRHLFPAGADDCAVAIGELWRRAEELGFDRSRVFVGGHSSGGHYASLLAVRRDWQAPLGLPVDVIKGCLPISGVYRFGEGAGLAVRPRFLGSDDAGVAAEASPIERIDAPPPPFFIAYGDTDFPHLRTQPVEMEKALRARGGAVQSLVMTGRDHFTASLAGGEENGPWVPMARSFIAELS
jgi:arylformamidase